jgi:hypothetical protein
MAPLFAFLQFGSPAMLAWGVAAALPILIHLWSRRRYREQSWAAMQFLLAALQKNARRIQLEQWLLLAVRVAILALFALAVAQPRWAGDSLLGRGSGDGPVHTVLVLDGSYSMDYRAGDKSRFESAKEIARQLVSAAGQGDGWSLVLMAQPPRTIIGQPAQDRDDVLREIDDLQLLHGGANLLATLAEVETLLTKTAERSIRPAAWTQRRVVVFSDMQQSTWKEAASSECQPRLRHIGALATLQLVDVGQASENNVALARVEIDSPLGGLVTSGSEIQIRAELQSYSRENRRRLPVEVLVDGARIAEQRTDLPAGGRATITASYRFDAPGEHVVEAHLADDALALDNRRWLVVPVREAIRVLLVGGVPADTRNLAIALAPERQTARPIEVVETLESRLAESDLAKFDCVILSNIGRFSRDEAALLHGFVSRGGGLVFFLGDRVQAESYNQFLVDDLRSRVLPARILDPAVTGNYHLDPLDYGHAVVAAFRGFEKSGLLTTPIWKYVRMTPINGSKTALAFNSGDAAIVETQVGRGRCIVVAVPASAEPVDRSAEEPAPWTALPMWPSFPPLVHEMLKQAIAGRDEGRNLLVGDSLTGTIPAASAQETVVLSGPGGINERLSARPENAERAWQFGPAIFAGIYSAKTGAVSRRYAVNVNSNEGDLIRTDPASLPAELRREPIDSASRGEPIANRDSPIFRYVLMAVLLLLVFEPAMAWHYGRRR